MKMKSYSFVAFDDPKIYTQEEVDALLKDGKGFTQDEVNAFLAKEKRKTQETQKQLADQLEEYKKVTQLSGEENVELEKRIEELQTKYMTVEERARQLKEKDEKKHGEEIDQLRKELGAWKQRYTSSTVENAITHAAVEHKAVVPGQIIAMLRSTTRLAEKLDSEDKPTGEFETRVMFADVDKDQKPVMLDLTVPEAVKRMTELEQFGNLFTDSKKGGLGGNNSPKKGGKIDLAKIAREDPAQYRKLRKEQPELFAKL